MRWCSTRITSFHHLACNHLSSQPRCPVLNYRCGVENYQYEHVGASHVEKTVLRCLATQGKKWLRKHFFNPLFPSPPSLLSKHLCFLLYFTVWLVCNYFILETVINLATQMKNYCWMYADVHNRKAWQHAGPSSWHKNKEISIRYTKHASSSSLSN